jgi:glucose-1-phosphate cytidylyltransferase
LPGGFCLTYADGVADVDLRALLAFHRGHGAAATMTVVRPRLPFGVARVDGAGVVRGFTEKPPSEHWVNGGFFCLGPAARAFVGADSVFEREPLESLAAAGQLRAYRHEGFWDCLDTYKDAISLNDLWAAGRAPWVRSPVAG